MRILFLILDKLLTDKEFLIPIFKFFGVYEEKKNKIKISKLNINNEKKLKIKFQY